MKEFSGKIAEDYDRNILKVLPGYDLAHQLTAAYLQTSLPNNAKILLVGAGTCKELELLGALNSSWKFYAQDIAQDMLNIAKQKLPEDIVKRTEFFHSDLSLLPQQKFDAVLSLFVLHFVESRADKKEFLQQIKNRLKPEGVLLLADLMTMENFANLGNLGDSKNLENLENLESLENTDTQSKYNFLANQYKIMGMSDAGVERSIINLRTNFYPLKEKELDKLLQELGFAKKINYFQALEFVAYIIKAK